MISLAALHTLCAGSTTTILPVFSTEFNIVCLSNGTSVLGSIISIDIPSSSNFFEAFNA